jgi:hypothetical protein
LIDSAKLAAVTGFPSENLNPDLTLKTYVLPSFEIAGSPTAASGRSRLPAAPSLSGKPRRCSCVAFNICQAWLKYASCGSM